VERVVLCSRDWGDKAIVELAIRIGIVSEKRLRIEFELLIQVSNRSGTQ
jgi:hypothetical protein